MKKIISAIFITIILMACSESPMEKTSSKQASTEKESDNKVKSIDELIQIDSKEINITAALLAAPEKKRDNCTVKGFNEEGEFVTLKEGDNELICLADDPNQDGFSVACYHKDLEPFMARGRDLKAKGKNGKDIFEIRENEIKSGELEMGKAGSTLHVYYGPKAVFDPSTGKVPDAKYRYVVYMPFATSESTGLPETPTASNHPWIMDPGTHKAHIMISPLVKN